MAVWNDYVYKLPAFDLNSRSVLCFPTLGMAFTTDWMWTLIGFRLCAVIFLVNCIVYEYVVISSEILSILQLLNLLPDLFK